MLNGRSKAAAAGLLSLIAGAVLLVSQGTDARAQPPGDAARGKQLFARCSVCHSVDPKVKKMGPTLANIVGRKAGTVPGFKYSAAMKSSRLTWTPQNLDKFLAAPRTLVPRTTMVAPPVASPADRANLVAYLNSVSKPAKRR